MIKNLFTRPARQTATCAYCGQCVTLASDGQWLNLAREERHHGDPSFCRMSPMTGHGPEVTADYDAEQMREMDADVRDFYLGSK